MNINKQSYEDAIFWILKEKEGLNKIETNDFSNWLEIDANKKSYEQNKIFFNTCNNLSNENKNILENELTENKIEKKENIFYNILKPLAASLIFILFSFGTYNYYDNSKITYQNSYITTNNINNNILLPDNSIIDLDIKSQVKISYYKNKRVVKFTQGKAIFKIAKNKKRPFIINSGKLRIEVVGTKFEVINLDNINTINVIEGIVRVSSVLNEKIKNLNILKKGDTFSLNNKGKVLNIAKVTVNDIGLWKDNILKFSKTTLKNALKKFKRYDDTKVEISDYETSQLKVSGEFSTKEINRFIEALPFIYPIKIIKENYSIKIMKKN